MSVEVRYVTKGECHCGVPYVTGERPDTCEHWWECDYGRIPSWEIDNPAPLVIVGCDFAHLEFKEGPRRLAHGAMYSVTMVPIMEPDGDITEESGIRMFQHIEHAGRRWTWELEPAHWADSAEIRTCINPIYLGRWPD